MIDPLAQDDEPDFKKDRATSTTDGSDGMTRREFVQAVATSGIGVSAGAHALAAERKAGEMIYRPLGRTGEKASAIGLAGFHIAVPGNEGDGRRISPPASDGGTNFIENACDYHYASS